MTCRVSVEENEHELQHEIRVFDLTIDQIHVLMVAVLKVSGGMFYPDN